MSLQDLCEEIYNYGGASAVRAFIHSVHPEIDYHYCVGCDADMPQKASFCLVCGMKNTIGLWEALATPSPATEIK